MTPGDPTAASNATTLVDGREIGLAEYGDPDGYPILYCHGFPGCRLDYLLTDPDGAAARDAGARIVALDRPGLGRSTLQRDRHLLDWPRDVAEVMDGLGIRHFAVLGVSGGGPYALACAHCLPERVTAAAIVSGMGPSDAPGMTEGISWTLPGKVAPARWLLLRLMALGLERDPDRFVAQSQEAMAQADGRLLDDSGVAATFVAAQVEAQRAGPRGALDDARIYRRPWGFDLAEVDVPVLLCHGQDDANVPVSVARHLAAQLPHCTANVWSGQAHLTVARAHASEILGALVIH